MRWGEIWATHVSTTQLTIPGTGAADTHGYAFNVDDYNISDMESNEVLAPSPSEIGSGSQRKGKGKTKATVTGMKKYTPEELKMVAKCYVGISEDPVVGSDQRVRTFWERVAEVYNTNKPTWKLWTSGANDDDIRAKAYLKSEGKDFKYYDVYTIVRDHFKLPSGYDVGGPKRTKMNVAGNYNSRRDVRPKLSYG